MYVLNAKYVCVFIMFILHRNRIFVTFNLLQIPPKYKVYTSAYFISEDDDGNGYQFLYHSVPYDNCDLLPNQP